MKLFCITGGIATGKTTICKIIKKSGYKLIDSDKLAKNLVKKGKKCWYNIINQFGGKILNSNGEISRIKLGEIIFNSSSKRKKLNKILHLQIIKQIHFIIKNNKNHNKIIILDIPLFFEIFREHKNTLLVYTPQNIQTTRLMKRDTYNKNKALIRINSQITIEKKRKASSIVLDNTKSIKKIKILTDLILKTLKIKNRPSQINKYNQYLKKT